MGIIEMQALQLVDSTVATTRRYWRKEFWKFSDEIADDPRPMKEILGEWPDWNAPQVRNGDGKHTA